MKAFWRDRIIDARNPNQNPNKNQKRPTSFCPFCRIAILVRKVAVSWQVRRTRKPWKSRNFRQKFTDKNHRCNALIFNGVRRRFSNRPKEAKKKASLFRSKKRRFFNSKSVAFFFDLNARLEMPDRSCWENKGWFTSLYMYRLTRVIGRFENNPLTCNP